MLLSRVIEKLQNLSSYEFALSRDLTRVEIQFTKSIADFLIKRTMLAVDLSFSTVLEAKQQNVNLIITPDSLFPPDMRVLEYHQVEIWRLLLSLRVSCIHLGSEWFNSNNGFSVALLNFVGLEPVDLFTVFEPDTGQKVPIGRIATFQESNFTKYMNTHFSQTNVLHQLETKATPTSLAVVPGGTISTGIVYQAIEAGCGAIIGGECTSSALQALSATGIGLYSLAPRKIFEIGLQYLKNSLTMEYPNDEFMFFAPP